jgi:hypothetical protein
MRSPDRVKSDARGTTVMSFLSPVEHRDIVRDLYQTLYQEA